MSHIKSSLMLVFLLSLLSVLLIGPDAARATPGNAPSLRTFGRIRNQSASERSTEKNWASDVVERSLPSAHIAESGSVKTSLPLPLRARLIPFLSTSSSMSTSAMEELLREDISDLQEPDYQPKTGSSSRRDKKNRLQKNH